jgi:hypothetical protein
MSTIKVKTGNQPGTNPFAQPLCFDFSEDVGSGERVVAYALGLSGFRLNYQTNAAYWARYLGQLEVSLVPNLIGAKLHVDCNIAMSDFDGSWARSLTDAPDPHDPPCGAQVTAIAVIDSSSGAVVAGNAYGLPSGKSSPSVSVGANTDNYAFLAGFSVRAASPGSIDGLSLATSVSPPAQQEVQVTGSVATSSLETTGAVDVGLLSVPSSSASNVAVEHAQIVKSQVDGEYGLPATLSASFDVPAGQHIVQAALLLESVDVVYGSTAAFQLISALLANDLTWSGSTVTGSFWMNILNPDAGAREYISSTSTFSPLVIAEFST